MGEHVLVPFDGSPQSEAALDHAIESHPNATITALTVIDPIDAGYGGRASFPSFSQEWFERAEEAAEELLAEAVERGDDLNRAVETDTVVGRPSRAIVEYADEAGVDAIVMGSHGRDGVARILLGSVAETVVRRSSVPVTVVR